MKVESTKFSHIRICTKRMYEDHKHYKNNNICDRSITKLQGKADTSQ